MIRRWGIREEKYKAEMDEGYKRDGKKRDG